MERRQPQKSGVVAQLPKALGEYAGMGFPVVVIVVFLADSSGESG